MKKTPLYFFIVCTGLLTFNSCQPGVKQPRTVDMTSSELAAMALIDSGLYEEERVARHINIGGHLFSIATYRGKYYPDHRLTPKDDMEFSPMQIAVVNEATRQLECVIKAAQNEYDFFTYSGAGVLDSNKLFLSLESFAGGSGYSGVLQLVTYDAKGIHVTRIMTYNELAFFRVNKNENEVLKFSGIWASDIDESHFAPHRYIINKYIFGNGPVQEIVLAKTKYKYRSCDDGANFADLFTEISVKEPGLIKDSLSGYIGAGKKHILRNK